MATRSSQALDAAKSQEAGADAPLPVGGDEVVDTTESSRELLDMMAAIKPGDPSLTPQPKADTTTYVFKRGACIRDVISRGGRLANDLRRMRNDIANTEEDVRRFKQLYFRKTRPVKYRALQDPVDFVSKYDYSMADFL